MTAVDSCMDGPDAGTVEFVRRSVDGFGDNLVLFCTGPLDVGLCIFVIVVVNLLLESGVG